MMKRAIEWTPPVGMALAALVFAGPIACEKSAAPATTPRVGGAEAAPTPGAEGGASGESLVARDYAALEALYAEVVARTDHRQPSFEAMRKQMAFMRGRMRGHRSMGHAARPTGERGGAMGLAVRPDDAEPEIIPRASALDAWNRALAQSSRKNAGEARSKGDAILAKTFDAIADKHEQLAKTFEQELAPTTDLSAGATSIYRSACAPCHRAGGEGVPGAFPPLRGDPVVVGAPEPLIRIVLQGMSGPLQIGSQRYFGTMPPFGSRLSDEAVSALLTYIRSAWGNNAPAIDIARVAAVRQRGARSPRVSSTLE